MHKEETLMRGHLFDELGKAAHCPLFIVRGDPDRSALPLSLAEHGDPPSSVVPARARRVVHDRLFVVVAIEGTLAAVLLGSSLAPVAVGPGVARRGRESRPGHGGRAVVGVVIVSHAAVSTSAAIS